MRIADRNVGSEAPMSRWLHGHADTSWLVLGLACALAACAKIDAGAAGDDDGSGASGGGDSGGGGDEITIPTGGNPFTDSAGYINPEYVAEVETAVMQHAEQATLLRKVEGIANAIWLDTISKVPRLGMFLDDALVQQRANNQAVVPIFVIYDLPDRDCAALASNGELSIANNGVQRYKTEYIDAIAAVFRAHPHQRIVAIIEPDSLGNIATNLSVPRCAQAEAAYRESVAYAIRTLAMDNTFLYVDAAHSGWLGWPANIAKIATVFSDVLNAAGGTDKVRGFVTNVANYTVLSATTELFD
jgi:cellulose 1,4-beta-cellobiosidase